jgi:hypothetical protein
MQANTRIRNLTASQPAHACSLAHTSRWQPTGQHTYMLSRSPLERPCVAKKHLTFEKHDTQCTPTSQHQQCPVAREAQ